jgi:toxin YhaV
LIVNGWQVFAHPMLLGQLEKLIGAVEAEWQKNPATYRSTANAKLLGALYALMFKTIPEDPTRDIYRQGKTLGTEYKHWFRAKFGNGRFRLFFRYSSKVRTIIFSWVNDESSLREYGAKPTPTPFSAPC